MSQKTNKKGLLKRKIISAFILVSFIFSNIFIPVRHASAMDINQLAANVMTAVEQIGAAIVKVGEGVLKAGIATTLNSFAQQLAMATVQGMATGNWGSQPLFFQFPLEDMLQQTLDQVTGDYLDKLSETLKYDICKPLNADLDWRFKIALNIIPEQRNDNVNLEAPKCTLSKFVDAINQSFENISNAVRKTFAADCFDKFKPNYTILDSSNVIDGAFDAGADIVGSFTSFTYEGLKTYYLYNTPTLADDFTANASYFTKKDTFYVQDSVKAECKSLPNIEGCFIKGSKVYTGKPVDGTCLDAGSVLGYIEKRTVSVCRTAELRTAEATCAKQFNLFDNANINASNITANSVNDLYSGDCVSYSSPYKTNNVYTADTAKQKEFLLAYKNCFLPKMSAAFKGLLEVGQLPKQKIQEQKTKLGCQDLTNSLLDIHYEKNAAEFYGAYDLYFKDIYWDKNKVLGKVNPDLYKQVLRAALISKIGTHEDGTTLNANGESFLGYLKSKINFFETFEQALVNCKKVTSGVINVSDCVNEVGEDGKVSSNDTNPLDTKSVSLYKSNFSNLMIKLGSDNYSDYTGAMLVDDLEKPTKLCFRSYNTYLNCVGLRIGNGSSDKNLADDASKIEQIKEDLTNTCLKTAENQVAALAWSQSERTKAYINQEKQKQLLEVEKEQEIVKADVAKSDVKPVSEPISHEIKSTPGMVTFNLEQSLGSGANMLQPTGDLFLDPIKIFLTVLLQEGSKKLMEGLFSRAFPTDGVDADLSALDDIGAIDSSASTATDTTTENTCSTPGPLSNGSICVVDGKYNNGSCQSCYCESRVGLVDPKGLSTYGTCQTRPSSR